MKRKTRLKRGKGLKSGKGLKGSQGGSKKRGKRINPRNAERRAKEWARAYGSEDRVRSVKSQPCIVPGCRNRPCDNAHITNGGMGRKSDADQIVPLCSQEHHDELDAGYGRRAFEEKYGVDLQAEAARIERLFPS